MLVWPNNRGLPYDNAPMVKVYKYGNFSWWGWRFSSKKFWSYCWSYHMYIVISQVQTCDQNISAQNLHPILKNCHYHKPLQCLHAFMIWRPPITWSFNNHGVRRINQSLRHFVNWENHPPKKAFPTILLLFLQSFHSSSFSICKRGTWDISYI